MPLPPVLPPSNVRGHHDAAVELRSKGPATYLDLMAALGTRDGRESSAILEKLYLCGTLARLDDGRYVLQFAATWIVMIWVVLRPCKSVTSTRIRCVPAGI